MQSTFAVVLDHNGGRDTDGLVHQLQQENRNKFKIHVLDNGSDPGERSRFITHETGSNLGIGGGINRCISLASESGAKRLCLIVNDLKLPVGAFPIPYIEYPFGFEDPAVAVSATITPKSNQALLYPWMIQYKDGKHVYRRVPHVDFIFVLLDLEFLKEIGGFPDQSFFARGFDLHLANQAKLRGRKIYVCDEALVEHTREGRQSPIESTSFSRFIEMVRVFSDFYGDDGWRQFVPYRQRDRYEAMRTGLGRMMRMVENEATEEELRATYKSVLQILNLQEWISRKERESPDRLF